MPVEPKSSKGWREDEALNGGGQPASGRKTIITTPGVTIVSEETEFEIQNSLRNIDMPSEEQRLEPESKNKRNPSTNKLPFSYSNPHPPSLRQSQEIQAMRQVRMGPASGAASKGEAGPMQSFILSS